MAQEVLAIFKRHSSTPQAITKRMTKIMNPALWNASRFPCPAKGVCVQALYRLPFVREDKHLVLLALFL